MASILYQLREKIVQVLQQLDDAVLKNGDLQSPLKAIRNMVIGNKTKKILFVEADLIPRLLVVIRNCGDIKPKVIATTVIGSLAYGGSTLVSALDKHEVFQLLLQMISSKESLLVEAAARALKIMSQYKLSAKELIFQKPYMNYCMDILKDYESHLIIAECIIYLLANSCSKKEEQQILDSEGILLVIFKMLRSPISSCLDACLSLIAAITKENPDIGKHFLSQEGQPAGLALLQTYAKHSIPHRQYLSLSCLAHLYLSHVESDTVLGISNSVLPTIVKLLDEPSNVKDRIPLLLVYLVHSEESLQKIALESGAIKKLSTNILDNFGHEGSDKLIENCLLAIAALTTKKEESRRQVVDCKLLSSIIGSLKSSSPSIRLAATLCIKNLSRSVKNLRSHLLDAGVAEPLFLLLSDESIDVRINACASICNIVMKFSALQKNIIDMGGIEKLSHLTTSMDHKLRVNSVWALKNLLYQSDSTMKQLVMKHLGFNALIELLDDPEIQVQENAISLLRNLTCGKEEDVENAFQGFGQDLLIDMLQRKIESGNNEIKTQALYTIANISSGAESHKKAIMSREPILKLVMTHLDTAAKPSIRVAAIWCIINLTWKEDQGSNDRAQILKSFELEGKLNKLLDDADADVKDRAKTALSNLQNILEIPSAV